MLLHLSIFAKMKGAWFILILWGLVCKPRDPSAWLGNCHSLVTKQRKCRTSEIKYLHCPFFKGIR